MNASPRLFNSRWITPTFPKVNLQPTQGRQQFAVASVIYKQVVFPERIKIVLFSPAPLGTATKRADSVCGAAVGIGIPELVQKDNFYPSAGNGDLVRISDMLCIPEEVHGYQ